MVSKPQAFPRRLSTLPGTTALPFAKLRWPLDASHFLKSPSPRNRSLSRSRKQRQDVHRLRRSSLVDGLFKVCTCMSAIDVRREKAALSSGCKPHPATAPAGSNRSSYGGDEIAEAFGMRVTNW